MASQCTENVPLVNVDGQLPGADGYATRARVVYQVYCVLDLLVEACPHTLILVIVGGA